MRSVALSLLLIFLIAGHCYGKVSVYPVIIEATDVKKGDFFQITCVQAGSDELNVHLSLALFDQKEDGTVQFLEDAESLAEASNTFGLAYTQFTLEPYGENIIEVEILRDDFANCYGVLFIKPELPGFATRFAVLFLLATGGKSGNVAVSSHQTGTAELELRFQNGGLSHGLWAGELFYYDAGGNLTERQALQSGIVLAGRSRNQKISLPPWVERIEISTHDMGGAR